MIEDDNGTTPSGIDALMEANFGQTAMLSRTGNGAVIELEANYDPKSKLGLSSTNDILTAAVGANPAENWYTTIYIIDISGNTTTVRTHTEIWYTVEFLELGV
jgi:hypothetical protein